MKLLAICKYTKSFNEIKVNYASSSIGMSQEPRGIYIYIYIYIGELPIYENTIHINDRLNQHVFIQCRVHADRVVWKRQCKFCF